MRRRAAALALALGVLAPAAVAQSPPSPVELTDVAVKARGEAVVVSIATSGVPKYRSELMDGPFRLVLDFEDTLYRWKTEPVATPVAPVKGIRGSQFRKGVARLVIDLTRNASYTLESDPAGLRVVFAPAVAVPPTRGAPARAARTPATPAWRLEGTVILDETPIAYIADVAASRVKRYAVGDPIGDGRVESIAERHVVLRMGQTRVDLRMEEPRPRR